MSPDDKPDEYFDARIESRQDNTLDSEALDALERLDASSFERQHLVPAHVYEQMDIAISSLHARTNSRLRLEHEYDPESVSRIRKGDAGEGYTFVRLLEQHSAESIVSQPRLTDEIGRTINPDFAIQDPQDQSHYLEFVDSKAWSLLRPKDRDGTPVGTDEFFQRLHEHPNPDQLVNMSHLRNVVQRYTSSHQLRQDGTLTFYFPGDIFRYAPQVIDEIEGWSGTEIAHGRTIKSQSMGIWNEDLWMASRVIR